MSKRSSHVTNQVNDKLHRNAAVYFHKRVMVRGRQQHIGIFTIKAFYNMQNVANEKEVNLDQSDID